jgi:hypothetical protein
VLEEDERDEEDEEEAEEEEEEYDEDLSQEDQQRGQKDLFQNEGLHTRGNTHFRKQSRKAAPMKEGEPFNLTCNRPLAETFTTQDELFKLLRMLSVEALEEEILELRMELRAEEKWEEEDIDFDEIKDSIDEANEVVERGGVGQRALSGIGAIIEDAHRLSAHIKLESGRLRGFCQSLIKAQTSLRSWIEGPVANEAYKAAKKG